MKVLFVGEGAHDIGAGDGSPPPWPARGVVPTLVRRAIPPIAADSVARPWSRVHVLPQHQGLASLAKKVAAARLIAASEGCDAVICVVDRDRPQNAARLDQMGEGADTPLRRGVPAACGLAVESVEAWTLGALDALAPELDLQAAAIREAMPAGVDVEALRGDQSATP